jgi:hypothetical protein
MSDDALRASETAFSVQRTVLRFKFVAEAEVTHAVDGVRLVARVSKLSAQGCYVDTPEAFPVRSTVRLRIRYGCSTYELPGKVIYAHSGLGMGILFGELGEAQRSVLYALLTELARKTAPRSDGKSPLR